MPKINDLSKASEPVKTLILEFRKTLICQLIIELICIVAMFFYLPIEYFCFAALAWSVILFMRKRTEGAFYNLVLNPKVQSEIFGKTFVDTEILCNTINRETSHAFRDLFQENEKLKRQLKALQQP